MEQQAGGMFSASDGGSGEVAGGGTGMGSGVAGAKDTVPRDQTSMLGVWNSRVFRGGWNFWEIRRTNSGDGRNATISTMAQLILHVRVMPANSLASLVV